MTNAINTKDYVGYLDKEMSIMGILSGVSVVAPGGILSAVMASDKSAATQLWSSSSYIIVAGAALCIIAGLCFYKQRSRLAWFYGQICLTEALNPDDSDAIREWLRDADSWAAWWPYSWGFTFLIAGAVEYFLAAFADSGPQHSHWIASHLHALKIVVFLACPVIAAVVASLQWYILTRHRYSDHYWRDFWSQIWSWWNDRKGPHDRV